MTIEELTQNTAFLFNNAAPIGIKLYFVLEHEGETRIRFADISAEVASDLKTQFVSYLQHKLINNPELHYAAITEADDTSNSVYHYNLDEQPEELQPLYDVQAEEIFSLNQNEQPSFPNFTFNQDDLSKITGFVICLGNEASKVVLYKKHYHVSLMKRGSYYGLLAVQAATRFEKLTDNVIKLNETVEFMLVGDELIVLSVKTFQNSFGFDKIIRGKAAENLVIIAATNLLEDIEVLEELATELKFAKKIMNIRHHSPVLQIPFADVRTFIQAHPKLRRRIKFNADQSRISLQSRSSKELFIKILNDDFLKSELTQLLYDSQKKAAMNNNEEPEEA
ncbi:MAG TPA: anti-phage protein KwaB [Puia sp.]|nr:anti-phage protein KwaB [Puia sp.]